MDTPQADFISRYVHFYRSTESPAVYHRWCAISLLGAMLGRRAYMPWGGTCLFPNMYILILGKAGDRKSTAIKSAGRIAAAAGYEKFAATKTTREAFLLDLEGGNNEFDDIEAGDLEFVDPTEPRETYIVADEFDEFIGIKNIPFIRLLGIFWDYDLDTPYKDRVKNSKSVSIKDPTVSILGGTTPTNFATAFPSEILGQGFFSRMILIHGERSSRRNAIPVGEDRRERDSLVGLLKECVLGGTGVVRVADDAVAAMTELYTTYEEVFSFTDARFDSYQNRRYTHLWKLCMIVAVANGRMEIQLPDVIYANTMLAYAEKFMPKALGEFGKSANSEVTHKIVELVHGARRIVKPLELWESVHTDLKDIHEMNKIIASLMHASKLKYVPGEGNESGGYLTVLKEFTGDLPYVDWSLLSLEEQERTR